MNDKKPKIGLALGGGGARGLAHIGVIKVLEENNIPIDFIAGSSAGAMIGAFYAYSKNIKKVEKVALSTDWRKALSLVDPSMHQGILGGDKVKKFIEDFIGEVSFDNLKIPLSVVATNLKTGNPEIIKKGNVASSLRASISLPIIFKPVKLKGKFLTDGGLSMPIPAEAVRNMGADFVIAVNLDADNHINGKNNDFGFYKIANISINILRYHLANSNIKNADFVISPKVGKFGIGQFLDAKKIIKEGVVAAKKDIKKLKDLL